MGMESTQFKPGNPGGPGRPKGRKSIPDILRKIGNEPGTTDGKLTKLDVVLRKVFEFAVKGKPWAVEFIAERTEGKAEAHITTDGEMVITWKPLSDTPRTQASSDSTPAEPDSE